MKGLIRAGLNDKNNPDAVNLRESYGKPFLLDGAPDDSLTISKPKPSGLRVVYRHANLVGLQPRKLNINFKQSAGRE